MRTMAPLKTPESEETPTPEATKADVIDGATYRLVISPRTMAWEIVRDIYKMQGRPDDAKVDCDLLVEMYLVNTSDTEIVYIKDIELSAEIKGERFSLKLQNDFDADEFNGQQYEYALKEDDFGEKSPLKKLLPSPLPLALAPGQPLEGWVRFLAENINPDNITEKSWQLAVVDSLGNKHAITKAVESKTKDSEIGLRRLRG
jgi:hypothetical protein